MPRPNNTAGFEENYGKVRVPSLLYVALRRGRKHASVEIEEAVALTMEEKTMESTHDTCYRTSNDTVHKIVRKVL